MKGLIFIVLMMFMLCSCGTGAIYVAKTEHESLKTSYDDTEFKRLYTENEDVLKAIYNRFKKMGVDLYKEGIGITYLLNENNEKIPYLMVNIRPSEIVFDVNKSKGEGRLIEILQKYVPKYIKIVEKEDLKRGKIKGLEFGIYWPVRDFSQCNQYGGFIEYVQIYSKKNDIQDFLDGTIEFKELVDNSEVITSLDLEPAKSIRPIFEE